MSPDGAAGPVASVKKGCLGIPFYVVRLAAAAYSRDREEEHANSKNKKNRQGNATRAALGITTDS